MSLRRKDLVCREYLQVIPVCDSWSASWIGKIILLLEGSRTEVLEVHFRDRKFAYLFVSFVAYNRFEFGLLLPF